MLWLVLFVVPLISSRVYGQSVSSLEELVGKSNYFALESTYNKMTETNKIEPKALYLAGYAKMRLHKPDLAKPFFERCIGKNFNGYPGWQSAKSILVDIATITTKTPPFYADLPSNSAVKLRVYAKKTGWSSPVLLETKHFVSHAQSYLGKDIPFINMYLFQKRADYNIFFERLFLNKPRYWQDGTGDSNITVFCEQDKDGQTIRPASRVVANTMHEYGHSLVNTIFGDNYLVTVPQWFDEGLADAIASPYNEYLFKEAESLLKYEARHNPQPKYKQMSRELYREPVARYAYARMMVRELLQGRPKDTARKIIDRARQQNGFEKAIFEVTGVQAPDLLDTVYNRYRRY